MENYILKCTKEQYQQYKDELTSFINKNTKSSIDTLEYQNIFLILYLSDNEYLLMKEFCDDRNLDISLDAKTIGTAK